jgi:hypothetical protein
MSEGVPTARATERPLSRIPFTAQAEANVKDLSYWMHVAAVISVIGAVAEFVSAFTPRQDFGKVIGAVIQFVIGIWIYQAGTAFEKVATTDVADQHFLMKGFTLLRQVFLLQSIMVIIAFAFVLIALTVALLFMGVHSPR